MNDNTQQTDKNGRHITICLSAMMGEKAFFKLMQEELNIPSYFGNNWDALDECMRDLSWLDETHIYIHIQNLDRVKNDRLRQLISASLASYQDFWQHQAREYPDTPHLVQIDF